MSAVYGCAPIFTTVRPTTVPSMWDWNAPGSSAKGIVRLTLDGDKVIEEERIPLGERTRDVVQGPDGAVYAITDKDGGKLLRITLQSPAG